MSNDEPAIRVATALRRVPGSRGHNWDALVDCLHDRHGHEGHTDDVVVLIEHADGLRDADFLGLFVSVLCQAAWKANLQLDADGVPNHRPPFAEARRVPGPLAGGCAAAQIQ
ncbi:barstar family protein [Streptomyces sp. BP-8]|uniref:barstar family protein n=1 Tax=Streptomyces sirii TaxID=3127701 RepID=UPI00388E411B